MSDRPEVTSMAVFCDFENIALGVRDAEYEKFDIRKVLERLLLKGSIVVKKAYCDWDRYKAFKAAMHEASFELIEIPHVRQSGKNSADIRMVVDALDLCYTKAHVDTFVIISGDSDFSPLVSKLRENAKNVIGVGVKNSTSDLLIANCDEFIFYDDLVREQRRRSPARRTATKTNGKPSARGGTAGAGRGPAPGGGEAAAAPAERPAGDKSAAKPATESAADLIPADATPADATPAPEATAIEKPAAEKPTRGRRTARKSTTRSKAAGKAVAAPPAPETAETSPPPTAEAPAPERPADAEEERRQRAIDLVVETVEALMAERGADDTVWGSMVKQTLKRRQPGFNESYYGFRSFNALLEEAEARGLLALTRDEKSGGFKLRLVERAE